MPAARLAHFHVVGPCANAAQAARLANSLSLQSYRKFSLHFVLPESEAHAVEELLELCKKLSLNGSVLLAGEGRIPPEFFESLLSRKERSFSLFLGEGMFLHPQALFAFSKAIIEHDPLLLYANEVTLSRGLRRTTEYYRKSAGDRLGVLAANPFGEGVCLEKSALHEVRSRVKRPCSGEELCWIAAAVAGTERFKVRFVRLGLLYRDDQQRASRRPTMCDLDQRNAALSEYSAALGIKVSKLEQLEDGNVRPLLQNCSDKVQVVIPFRDKPELLASCIKSLSLQSCADRLEITLVDNESSPEALSQIRALLERYDRLRISLVPAVGYFNYAWLNNIGAQQSSAPFILLLNNDVELLSEDTIAELLRWGAIPEVGVVGGRLFYPDGAVQSAGINFAPSRPVAVHLENMFMDRVREVNAVTFAMALIKRSAFEEAGGLDEFHCPNGFGDALFCASARRAGYRIVYTPYAAAIHYESRSRDLFPEEIELQELVEQGVPISDLFSDFEAINQPTRVTYQVFEEPALIKLAWKVSTLPKLNRIANRLAGGLLSLNRLGRSLRASLGARLTF